MLKQRGITAVKTGGVRDPLHKVAAIREAVGDDVDIMVDLHGPPWMTPKDAIVLGRALEPYHLLFLEDPVAPENIESLARVSESVAIPIAAGERLATIWGWRAMIEREIVDVIQPDTGRAGGISQMKKLAGMAEAHHIMMAPHSGTLGPGRRIRGLAPPGRHTQYTDAGAHRERLAGPQLGHLGRAGSRERPPAGADGARPRRRHR